MDVAPQNDKDFVVLLLVLSTLYQKCKEKKILYKNSKVFIYTFIDIFQIFNKLIIIFHLHN